MTTESTAALASQVTARDTSPHPYLVPSKSDSTTETIQVYHERRWCISSGWKSVTAALAPGLEVNLITRALVKKLGCNDYIQDMEKVFSPQLDGSIPLKTFGCVELEVIFTDNPKRTWDVLCVLVEDLWIDLMLGKEMCENAGIKRGLELGPLVFKKQTDEERKESEENDRKAREKAAEELAKEDRQNLAKKNVIPKGDQTTNP